MRLGNFNKFECTRLSQYLNKNTNIGCALVISSKLDYSRLSQYLHKNFRFQNEDTFIADAYRFDSDESYVAGFFSGISGVEIYSC